MEQEKEKSESNMITNFLPQNEKGDDNNENDKKIFQMEFTQNEKDLKTDNNKINEKDIIDDDIEHPLPLESDYSENGKDEIKNDFYQNQLKEKIKLQKANNMIIKENGKIMTENDLKVVKKLENSFDSVSKPSNKNGFNNNVNSNKIIYKSIKKNENFYTTKKMEKLANQEKEKKKSVFLPKAQNNEKERDNKENMNSNIIIKDKYKDSFGQSQNINSENIKINNIQSSNQIINQNKKILIINKNPSNQYIQYNNKTEQNMVPQNISNNHNNPVNHICRNSNYLMTKIQKSMDYNKNIIYNNCVFENNKSDINKIPKQNNEQNEIKKQIQILNNSNINHELKEDKQNNQVKKKMIKNKIGIKSQSYTNINVNKKYNIYIENTNKEKIEEKTSSNNNDKSYNCPKKIPIQISNHDDKCIDCYAVKNTKIDNIPMFLKKQKYINTNKEIKNCCHNNKSFQIKSNLIPLNNELKIINSSKIINTMNNNIGFYNNTQPNHENNSCKKKTIDVGGKFNNIQTTCVVFSKKRNSKLKLIPKPNKTIDLGNNLFVNQIQPIIFKNNTFYFNSKENINFINYGQATNNNNYFYTEKQKYFKNNIPSNYNRMKSNKSQSLFQFKKLDNLDNNIIINGINYNNNNKNMESKTDNKNIINNNQFMNISYKNNSHKKLINNIYNCENCNCNCNYINYGCNHVQNNAFLSHSNNNETC